MKKRRRLITIAILLVVIAALNMVILQNTNAGEPPLISGWRLFLTLILSLFLALGKNTARWITAILTGLGSLGGIAGLAMLIAAKIEVPALIYVWMAAMTVLYAGIFAFLVFSPGVAREIRRASALG
jgi:peptidoglycan/LPS O-acetylase OafA/YrhL